MAVYSWSEAQQIINFYEQMRELIIKGWIIRKRKDEFEAVDIETKIVYSSPTLEILLSHLRDRNEG